MNKYKFTKSFNNWVVFEYDKNDNLVKVTYSSGNVYEYIHDDNNNHIKTIEKGIVIWEAPKEVTITLTQKQLDVIKKSGLLDE